jgi:NAD(P)-dependent dehydrogenase (short-subunit alcohol dehydrogenase family)
MGTSWADVGAGRSGSGQDQRRADGACVVVTGAAGGIGRAVVERLLHDGWAVLATDRDDDALQNLQDLAAGQARLRTMAMDVCQRAQIDAVARAIAERGVPVAGLVNVAGVLQDVTRFLGMDAAAQQRVWDINYFGAEQCLQVFAPAMVANGGGAIVNITSINAWQPMPLYAYAPAKVALDALTRLAAGELGRQGIRVNAVAPGFTLTPIFQRKLESGKRDPAVIEAHTALRRLVSPDEIACAVSFLLSDQSSAITGISLPVDAGWLSTAHWMNFQDLVQD